MGSFCLALLVYACAGSPTPEYFGLSECVTALLLLVALRLPDPAKLPVPVSAFMLYGLSLPLLLGSLAGHSAILIARDLVAFGFLLMPVLFYQTASQNRDAAILMTALVGLAFAVRTLIPYSDVLLQPSLWLGQAPADLLYLANSPEVLFAALLCLSSGMWMIWAGKSLLIGTGLMILSGLPLLAMAVMMQRAGLGCVALAALILGLFGLWRHPARFLLTAGITTALAWPLLSFSQAVTAGLVLKTEMVGLNSRSQEWSAVLDLVTHSPWTLLAGLGWGATFENPAVGHLTVNYTHSLISALLLKTGLAGVVLCAAYLWMLAGRSVTELWRRPVLMIALAAPLGIGLLFYASYKCFGFGLLLLLLRLTLRTEKLEKNQADMP